MDSHLKDYVEQCESQLHSLGLITTKTDFSILDNQFRKSQLWHLFWNHIDRVYFSVQQQSRQGINRLISNPLVSRPIEDEQRIDISVFSSMRKTIRRMNVSRNQNVDKQLRKENKRHKAAKKIIQSSFGQIRQGKQEGSQQQSFKYYIKRQMLGVIQQKERQLFVLSIVRIAERPFGVASIYMDPCFRVTQLERGSQAILRLMDRQIYNSLCKEQEDPETGWCHYCRNRYRREQMTKCQYRNKVGHNSQLNIISNPLKYLFKFCKKDTDCSAEYYYPYLQYQVDESLEHCERMFCEPCLDKIGCKPLKATEIFFCPFCTGNCNCQRCVLADQIAKHQAEYFRNDGQVDELMNQSIIYSSLTQPVPEQRQQVGRVEKKKRGRPCKSIRSKLMYEFSETKENSNVLGMVLNDVRSEGTDMAVQPLE